VRFVSLWRDVILYVFSYGNQDERGKKEEYGPKNQTVMGLYEIAYKTGGDSVFSPTMILKN